MPPSRIIKVDPERLAALMPAIVPIELVMEPVDGTWTLTRNKADEVRRQAAEYVAAPGFGHERTLLVELTRSAPEAR